MARAERILRIFPALGVARIGDARPDAYFVGPETPGLPANFDPSARTFAPFKEAGRIKRQAARFRIFQGDDEIVAGRDAATSIVTTIEWSVHVANRKASFGEVRNRMPGVSAEQRRSLLDLDPGPRRISGRDAGPVALENPHARTADSIAALGELRTDGDGRLLVLGGCGRTAQLDGAQLRHRLDNDGWFDDVSDGSVGAVVTVTHPDGTAERFDAIGAWVVVGPPDFAPPLMPMVSMYDVLWDQAVRELPDALPLPAYGPRSQTLEALRRQRLDWRRTGTRFTECRPSFAHDIAPLFERAFQVTFVHRPPGRPFHATLTPKAWADLGDPANAKARAGIFEYLRDPDATRADARMMPRAFGDEYVDERPAPADEVRRNNPRRFLSLTRVQYAMVRQWAEGKFEADGAGPAPWPGPLAITPEGLDRAALERCVGAPLFPGFELGSHARSAAIFAEPFRIAAGLTPGYLTQELAVPWQADFRDCRREVVLDPMSGERIHSMWWSSQRPDEVLVEREAPHVPWLRPPHFVADDGCGDEGSARFAEMVAYWSSLGFVARDEGGRLVETEREP